MAARTFPNDYFAWFNDDQRIAILALDTTSTTSGERTTEKYDTFQGDGNLSSTITGVTRSSTTATYTTSAAHSLAVNDRVSISGTTDYNDAALSSQSIVTVPSTTTFTMTLSAGAGSTESGLSASMTSLFVNDGLRITYKSKYETVDAVADNLDTDIGLDTALHPSLVCYVKSRLYEDRGNFEQANYFRQMYETQMMKQRSRKSGIRGLSVPNL
tara:strand:+ start:1261 stop:1902 length:642 start_codon:yes stop_codon:yes gene_type:complete